MQTSRENLVGKGRDKQALVYGAAALAVAAVAVFLGLSGWTLTVGRLALPGWSMFVAAGGAGLLGLVLVVFSDTEVCKSCQSPLSLTPAYFPLETESQVMEAVQARDPSALFTLPPVPKNQMKMHLDIRACTGCGQIAEVGIIKWQDYQPHSMGDGIFVQGAGAEGFRRLAQQHADWRGDDDE